MSDWRPIETAPKDGAEVLFGHWMDDMDAWLWVSQCSYDDDAPKNHYWSCIHDNWLYSEGFHKPTHWQPLPDPPEKDE